MTVFTAKVRTLYFARPIGKRDPIKIGCTVNLKSRLQQLRPIARSELELVASTPGSMDDERRIQSMFWHDRIEGEWFKWSRVLQILMDAAARGELEINALPPTRVRPMPEKNEWRRRANA